MRQLLAWHSGWLGPTTTTDDDDDDDDDEIGGSLGGLDLWARQAFWVDVWVHRWVVTS
jgi:hypothetical protein